jgi:serine/threonine protein kinase
MGGILGRGGMGIVYRAHDPALDRPVAIKLLKETISQDPDFIERFLKEARIAARLRHPNIVSIHEVGRSERGYCYVMDFIDGETLSGIVRRRGPLSFEDASRILTEVARAIGYAHESAVLHRDLKPENVMIDRQGNVIVMDFGLARAADDPKLTKTGAVLGSPLYMSPEQMEGLPIDHRSDIFSLGLIFYFLLSGKHFYRGSTISSIVRHMRTVAIREAVATSRLPAPALPILHRMLERDPGLRANDLREITAAIQDAAQRRPSAHAGVSDLPTMAPPTMAPPQVEKEPGDLARRVRERLKGLLDRLDTGS